MDANLLKIEYKNTNRFVEYNEKAKNSLSYKVKLNSIRKSLKIHIKTSNKNIIRMILINMEEN